MSQPDITDRLDDLEAQLDDQQETIEQQQERIDQQAETIERQQERLEEQDAIIRDQRERLGEEATPASESDPAEQEPVESETADDDSERPGPIATRRGVLTAGSVLGLLGLGAGSASADASGQIGTSSDPLQDLYTANLHGDSGTVTVNDNLDLTSNNINNAASIDNGGSAISVDDTLQLGGNKIKAGSGSSDVVIQADDGSNPGNILMGRSNNSIGSSIHGAVISGGGAENNINEVSADYGAVGGGQANVVKSLGSYGTIPGGNFCEVDGNCGFAVGYSCSATANYASAIGGEDSHASAANATVAGGKGNTASADYAFVGGGRWNEAGGTTAFAAGAYAHAADSNSFVWNDGSGASGSSGAFDDQFKSTTTAGSTPTGAETFSVKAKGGVRFITSGDNSSHVWVDTSGNVKTSGNVDVQGGTVENTTGGLTVTTNDMGNLTLDPGANYELNLSNQTTGSSGSLLAIDGSGNVVEASGTTLSDVGGTPSSLVTNGNAVTSMEVFEGGTGSAISGTSDGATPPNVIGGHPSNNTGGKDVKGATIAGGGGDTAWPWDNEASATWATVGGGKHNTASNSYATVSGGEDNTADGKNSTVPGGLGGAAEDDFSFVWNDGITHHSIPNSDTDGLSSSTAVDNETVTGSHTFSVSAKNGFRFITGSATNPNVTYIDSSGKFVSSGGVDAQGGTVENTTGALSLSTSSGDLDLQPSGNIDLNSNRISNAKEIHSDSNNITFKGTADVNLDGTRLTEKGGDMNIASTNSVNVDIDNDSNDSDGTRDFNVTKDGGSTTLFTVNDGGQVDIFQGDLDMNSGGNVTNESDARLKTAIKPIENPTEKLTELQPRTYEWKAEEAADGREAGVIAQSVKDALPEAVKEDEDGFLKLAYRQLTPLVIGAVQEQQTEIEKLETGLDAKDARIEDQHDRIERLESKVDNKGVALDALREALDDRDERIDDLEAENEQLREHNAELEDRLAAVEAELGIEASAGQQGVADD